MPTTPDSPSHRRPRRNYLGGVIIALAAIPFSVWLAIQSEVRIVSHQGPGGPRTPPFGTVYFDELFGSIATDGGEVRADDSGGAMTIADWRDFDFDPLFPVFFANIRERVTPYLRNGAGYDIWLAERGQAKVSGWPFSSWQRAEYVFVDEFWPEAKSKNDEWREFGLPIASDGTHPRRPLLFAVNAAFYWGTVLVMALLIRRYLRRRRRLPKTGFPVVAAEEHTDATA